MKNQNDLIITIVTVVLALIAITAFYFTKPVVTQPPAPEKVITTKPQMPLGDVQYANSLPGASNTGGGGPSGGGGGRRGGPSGVGGGGGGGMTPTLDGATQLGR